MAPLDVVDVGSSVDFFFLVEAKVRKNLMHTKHNSSSFRAPFGAPGVDKRLNVVHTVDGRNPANQLRLVL